MRKTKTKNRPTHRVSFARVVGQDDKGNDILGSAREIGAIWPRQKDGNSILRLDHIPVELTRHNGVLFIKDVREDTNDQRGFA